MYAAMECWDQGKKGGKGEQRRGGAVREERGYTYMYIYIYHRVGRLYK